MRPRLKRAGEAPGELAGRLSCPFQLLSAAIPAPIRPLACMEGEFRTLLSAIRRIISPAGKSTFLSIRNAVIADMRTQSEDTDLQAERVQLDLLRRATVAKRATTALSLSQTVVELARKAIRRQNPELSKQEVLLRFVAVHYGPELAGRLAAGLERRRK